MHITFNTIILQRYICNVDKPGQHVKTEDKYWTFYSHLVWTAYDVYICHDLTYHCCLWQIYTNCHIRTMITSPNTKPINSKLLNDLWLHPEKTLARWYVCQCPRMDILIFILQHWFPYPRGAREEPGRNPEGTREEPWSVLDFEHPALFTEQLMSAGTITNKECTYTYMATIHDSHSISPTIHVKSKNIGILTLNNFFHNDPPAIAPANYPFHYLVYVVVVKMIQKFVEPNLMQVGVCPMAVVQ